MGIETIIFVIALIVAIAIWRAATKKRSGPGSAPRPPKSSNSNSSKPPSNR